ncbi:MAG: hypothetical protein L0H53_03960 [Candidatus Nitrosocosmicus sp.]|nr:hypothetical protein [Candidatus Nitrosocosmicus sp.]
MLTFPYRGVNLALTLSAACIKPPCFSALLINKSNHGQSEKNALLAYPAWDSKPI